ncbi:hypothetical protein ABT373_36535 [Streptomyces sp. NPDC000070]|uniref:hypothetical protein n=1 Tax=Streptomyces sp. NPDC000070 TaxID=3154240 RepID=UPI0033244EA5
MVPPPAQLDEDEVGEAVALIEAMARDDLTGPEFTDHYSAALHEVIEAKREDRQLPQAPEPEARPGPLVDLMAALQDSVDKARAARGETGDADRPEVPAAPVKKAAVRKTPGKATARAASSRTPGARAIGEEHQHADLPWSGPWSRRPGPWPAP